jgi:hypothetical protein
MIERDLDFYTKAFENADHWNHSLISHHLKLAADETLPEMFRTMHANIILYELIWIYKRGEQNGR